MLNVKRIAANPSPTKAVFANLIHMIKQSPIGVGEVFVCIHGRLCPSERGKFEFFALVFDIPRRDHFG